MNMPAPEKRVLLKWISYENGFMLLKFFGRIPRHVADVKFDGEWIVYGRDGQCAGEGKETLCSEAKIRAAGFAVLQEII